MGIFFTEDRLCVQILHGRVSAFVEKNGLVIREVHYADPCNDLNCWKQCFSKILKDTSFKGSKVSFVISDPRAHFLVVQTPPMKAKDLKIFLSRKARQEWKEREPMRFGWSVLKAREGFAVLLQILPEEWVQTFVQCCRDHGLQPLHVFTANAAAIRHLKLSNRETGMIALDTGISALFVVSRGGEAPVLVRELSVSWNQDFDGPMRVAQEIQRTQLFAKQQLGAAIAEINLQGKGASLLAEVTEKVVGVKPVAKENAVVWAAPFTRRMRFDTDNFLEKNELSHSAEKVQFLISSILMTLSLIAILLAAFKMHSTLDSVESDIQKGMVQNTINELNSEKEALSLVRTEIQSNYALGTSIAEESRRPVPGWFAGIVGDLVPDGMVLTGLWVHSDSVGTWLVEIGGLVPRDPLKSEKLLESFQQRLASIPNRFEEKKSWKVVWIENLKYGSSWDADESTKQFVIQGEIQ